MMETLARIAALQQRFATLTPARPVVTAAATTPKSFSTVLADSRTKVASSTPNGVPAAHAEYASMIGQIATDEGVPASLLGALVWSESSFNPDAVSSAGARGLAQLMPATASGLGVDIDNPVDNLRGGARYLRQMLDRFGDVEHALAAYNAGPGAVERYDGIPPYEETQNYVARVIERASVLRANQLTSNQGRS
jgi:peptidoglycan DL-endopeptidase CwlO